MSRFGHTLEQAGAILLALIWISPLLFAFWAAFHTSSDAVSFNVLSPWTLDNFRTAWEGAPWLDRKSTRLNSSHSQQSRMPSSA